MTTLAKDAAGTELQKTVSTYVTDNSQAPFVGWNYRYLSQVANYVRSGTSLILTSKTAYLRDGGTGNLAVKADYLGSTLYRKQYYEYRPNFDPAVHILDKATRQLLVDSSNQIIADTRFVYDNGASTLSRGELTLVQRLLNTTSTSDTRYEYDQYGNATKTCVNKTYGTVNIMPTGGICSEVTYDTTVNAYPVESINPLGQTSTSTYIYQLGLPYQATDPNNFTTTTTYDRLGRTLTVTPPGLPAGKSGVKYTYPVPVSDAVTAPYNVKMELWDGTASTYRSVWGIYDGMGRMLETQTWDSDRGELLISESQFNAQGLAWKQSLPYYTSGTGGTRVGAASQFTETVFDALGRATQVTSPGNIISTTEYNGLITTSIDPNGNKVVRTTDGLGRLKLIQEYNGTSVYAATIFSYDQADRLQTIKDAQNNLTTLTYDNLGRKTGMDDPDMGIWTYQYDALGSLTQQDDARGQTLTFTYDDLNRLTQKKDYDLNVVLASYTYGTSSPEVGFRKTMTDTSGSASWTYSNYGRTVVEAKTVNAVQKSTTTASDWLGRVLTVTYPDNEILTYQYDALGRAKSFRSNQNAFDFASIGYNELSQMMNVNLGNGVRIENTYDPTTHRLDQRTAVKGTSTFIDFEYEYDPAGNITDLTDNVLDEIHTYQYDFLNRLTSAEAINNTDFAYRQTFEYDKVGNILTRQDWESNDLIFKNDFETVTPSGWSSFVSDAGEIWTVGSNGFPPVSGARSIVFDINDNTALYAEDTTPSVGGDETQYRARFYFNPNSITMATPTPQDVLDLFIGYKSGGTQVFRVQLQKSAGVYQIRVGAMNDASAWTDSAWTTIVNQWTSVEIRYLSAANAGSLELWINGTSVAILTAVDNDTNLINKVRLGASGVQTGTRGQILYDAFESRRVTYIGPLAGAQASAGNFVPVVYQSGAAADGSIHRPLLVADTGWISPTANAAVTSSSGDNNGFQTNPTNAYSDDGTFTEDPDSGTGTKTSCSDGGKDRHVFYTYDLSSLPGDATIVGIEVRLDIKVDSTTGTPKSCIELSWDGGSTWTAAQTSGNFTTSEATYTLGGSTNTWGRTWTVSELSNFRVRITDISSISGSTTDFSLDWIPVKVYYDSSAPTNTPTATPTNTFTPSPTPSSGSTAWTSPTINAAVTSGAGDNNGFQTDPTNAYGDNATFAADTDSGINNKTSCGDGGKDRHVFYGYDLSSVPGGASIHCRHRSATRHESRFYVRKS